MKEIKFGKWKFSVDEEKTRAYYSEIAPKNTLANKNFAKYCESLTEAESALFEAFCVDIAKCDVNITYYKQSKNMYSTGGFVFCGKCEEAPHEFDLWEEELSKAEFGNIVQIEEDSPVFFKFGNFDFQFQREYGYFADLEENIPEGFIYVAFCCNNMKWLLNGKPKDNGEDVSVIEEPPGVFELHRRLYYYCIGKYNHLKYMHEVKTEYAKTFAELGAEYRKMGKREYEKYRKEWVLRFAPKGADIQKISEHCLKNDKYGVYLWHLYSYDHVNCAEGEEARKLFNCAKKCKLILIDDWNAKGYVLQNTKKLNSAVLAKFTDVTITPANFAWTYSKTHEEDWCGHEEDWCGPYFYKNNNL